MYTTLSYVAALILGIIAGIFIEKKNSTKINAALQTAQQEAASAKSELAMANAALTAAKNAVQK
jgi:hypothetical protein